MMPSSSPASWRLQKTRPVDDLRRLIVEARQDVARTVNSALVIIHRNIGERIRREILREVRAEYGKEIFYSVRRKLAAEFGDGFSEKSLRHMVRFVEVFPDEQIVSPLI